MSKENEKEKIEEPTSDEDETKNILDTNVALVIAERNIAIEKLSTALDEIENLKKRIAIAEALIEEDSKAAIIKEIAPYCSIPTNDLALKTVDELEQWKKVLNYAKTPTFKAGTPIKPVARSPEAKLASAFDDYADKTWRKS